MSKETEDRLKSWDSESAVPLDDMTVHMNDFGRWSWYDIAEEGRRISNLMFDEDVESDSPADAVIHGVAVQAAKGVFAAVAAALGVSAQAFEMAMEPWYEDQDDHPKPMSPEKLVEEVKKCQAWLDGQAAGEPFFPFHG